LVTLINVGFWHEIEEKEKEPIAMYLQNNYVGSDHKNEKKRVWKFTLKSACAWYTLYFSSFG
jgi:hypothetical protein